MGDSLEKSMNNYDSILAVRGTAIIVAEENTTIFMVNDEFEILSGFTREEIEDKKQFTDFFYGEELEHILEYYRKLGTAGHCEEIHCETSIRDRAGNTKKITLNMAKAANSRQSILSMVDVTERRKWGGEHEANIELLHHINSSTSTDELLSKVLGFLEAKSGCSHVGIRLHEGGSPFSESLAEESIPGNKGLFTLDQNGEVVLNRKETALIDWMYEKTIVSSYGISTVNGKEGSFWTNSVTELVEKISIADLSGQNGKSCYSEGNESAAVILLRTGGKDIGFVYFGDPAIGSFTPRRISMLERVGDYLAIALAHTFTKAAFQETREQLELMLDGGDVGQWDWNVVNGSLRFNQRGLEMLGYSSSEFEASFNSWQKLVHPDDRFLVANSLDKSLVNKNSQFTAEYRLLHKSGEWKSFLAKGKVSEQDESGAHLRLTGILYDISGRKDMEAALSRSEARSRALFTAIPDLIIRCRHDGTILDWHDPHRNQLNCFGSNLTGKNIADVFSPEMEEVFNRQFPWWLQDEEAQFCFRLSVRGKSKYFEARMVRSGPDEILAILRDISERKQTEDEITRYLCELEESRDQIVKQAHDLALMAKERAVARDQAEAANRTKSEFLANMSHEIRTPMNSIIGMSELLLTTGLSDDQQNYARGILHSGTILLDVINEILDFSRIESGKIAIDPTPFNLRSVFEDVAELLSPKSDGKKVELILRYPSGIPSCLIGDAGRIRQVLVNLVGNAIKFTEQGHVLMDVECLAKSDKEVLLKIKVADTGMGISEDNLHLLFQKFSQLNTCSSKFSGTGLGLAISKSLVEIMGGTIGVESSYGNGSVFWFTLQAPVDPLRPCELTADSVLAGKRALIVDNKEVNRSILTDYLCSWGVRNDSASSGKRALEMMDSACAENDPYLIALIDGQIPAIDGVLLGNAIKAGTSFRDTNIIILSSLSCQEQIAVTGMVGSVMLAKPVRLHQLHNALVAVCSPGTAGLVSEIRSISPTETNATRTQECFKGLNVLVAEDNPSNQMVVVAMLHSLGCRTDVVVNGRDAVEKVRQFHYDFVFMDCFMPDMDGFEATAEIRRLEGEKRHTNIIALTASAMKGYREKCLSAGMDDYMSKPVRSNDLLEMVERWSPSNMKAFKSEPMLPEDDSEQAIGNEGFDIQRLQALGSMFSKTGKDFFVTVLEPFLNNADESIPLFLAAIEQGHYPGLRDTAHRLLGGSRNLGMQNISQICSTLLNNVERNRHDNLGELVSTLATEISQTRENLRDKRVRGLI